MRKNRKYSIDILRIYTFLSLIFIHFFKYTGYYQQRMIGVDYFWLGCFRELFFPCVAIFLLMTGYLMANKVISKQYYGGIYKILFPSLLASLVCTIYFLAQPSSDPKNVLDLPHTIIYTLTFTKAEYGWYIGMYLGLYLFIPFLNILFHVLNKKLQDVLIVTLFGVVILPTFLNVFSFDVWKQFFETSGSSSSPIISDYWNFLYPVFYYFLGCYFRLNRYKINIVRNIIYLIIVILAGGAFLYLRTFPDSFLWGKWDTSGGLLTCLSSTLIFGLFVNRGKNDIMESYTRTELTDAPVKNKKTRKPGLLKRFGMAFLRRLQRITLPAFIMTEVFDDCFYHKDVIHPTTFASFLEYFNIYVWRIAFFSLLSALAIDFVYEICRLPIRAIRYARKNN